MNIDGIEVWQLTYGKYNAESDHDKEGFWVTLTQENIIRIEYMGKLVEDLYLRILLPPNTIITSKSFYSKKEYTFFNTRESFKNYNTSSKNDALKAKLKKAYSFLKHEWYLANYNAYKGIYLQSVFSNGGFQIIPASLSKLLVKPIDMSHWINVNVDAFTCLILNDRIVGYSYLTSIVSDKTWAHFEKAGLKEKQIRFMSYKRLVVNIFEIEDHTSEIISALIPVHHSRRIFCITNVQPFKEQLASKGYVSIGNPFSINGNADCNIYYADESLTNELSLEEIKLKRPIDIERSKFESGKDFKGLL